MDPKKDSYKTKEDKFIVIDGVNSIFYSPSFGNSASRYKFVSHLFSSSDCHGTYPPEFYTLKFKNDYDFSLTLLYSLDGNIKDVPIEEYFDKGGVTIIEWAEMITDNLPEERLDIRFKIVDEETRTLVFIPHGQQYEEICEAVL